MSKDTRDKLKDHETRIAQLEAALLEKTRNDKAATHEKVSKKQERSHLDQVWRDIQKDAISKRRDP